MGEGWSDIWKLDPDENRRKREMERRGMTEELKEFIYRENTDNDGEKGYTT